MNYLILLLSCLVTAALVPCVRRLALKKGFVDTPDTRKVHEGAIPPVGGLVIFSIFLILSAIFSDKIVTHWPFFAALILLLVTGAIDDARGVPARLKFLIHFIAAISVVFGGATLIDMGNLLGFGATSFGIFAPLFSVCCVVYLINAMNMMDGIDGLCGGLSLIVSLFLIISVALAGQEIPLELFILTGGLAGYLLYNLRTPFCKKALVFLGDAGSMCLGLSLAWYAITLSQEPANVFVPITVAWILALPIWDAFGLFSARIRERRHPFDPDKRHFHHHFLEAGFTAGQATPLILLYAVGLSAFGVFAPKLGVPVWVLTYIWIFMWLAHAQLSYKPQGFIELLKKLKRA